MAEVKGWEVKHVHQPATHLWKPYEQQPAATGDIGARLAMNRHRRDERVSWRHARETQQPTTESSAQSQHYPYTGALNLLPTHESCSPSSKTSTSRRRLSEQMAEGSTLPRRECRQARQSRCFVPVIMIEPRPDGRSRDTQRICATA